MNGKELKSFSHYQILTWIAYSYLSRNLENWLILKFVFIHCNTVKVIKMIKFECKHDLQVFSWWMEQKLRSFSDFHILTKIAYQDLSKNLENWLILKVLFIHCKTVKVSQDDRIRMYTWFASVFLMNGTELRSFSHFKILTKIVYPDRDRNLQID